MGILWTSVSVLNLAAHQGNPIPEVPLLLVGLVFATSNWTFAWMNAKRVLKTNCFRGEIEFTFGEEGFSTVAPNANSQLRWPAVTRWVEGSQVFVLFPQKAMGHLVPKRFFGASDLEAIRRILKENVGDSK